MPSTKEIRTRIKSVKNTAQITRAMQLVAASKMKKAQDATMAGRAYAMLLAEILESVSHQEIAQNHPLLAPREAKRRGILIIGTDKGLCGPLNGNLFKEVMAIKDDVAYVTIGRKATQFISRTKRPLLADFPLSDKVTYPEVRAVVNYMLELYTEGKIDTIEILYSAFVNTLIQQPTIMRIVPLSGLHELIEDVKKRYKITLSDTSKDEREFIFEPSAAEILHELPALYVKQLIYQSLLGAKASEHSARMVAMKSATDNAKNLVSDLTLEYNKARQAAITQEILEIAAATQFN
ncbi:ATP synthase F1 subunit gamma [Cerasicoccus arenae]|uniref:ATP synthase gamma chain n=1 Tax=Cerasicoccus arenae TaxID=424488 RepID=A0A8J3DFW7_9BACT|nr:ATP synthase F1 subunit gamma [Cerasicoccus arenae]MBK1858143.1 ATP synthase F1 subunit gamma [Cerasicoccus arenae]GHB96757.1 ATP synthase gamma chain [Cerasicoccus arenae]